MRYRLGNFIVLTFLVCSSIVSTAQVNLNALEEKGFAVKSKLKPYKKTDGQVFLLKIKNMTRASQQINFQLFLFVDGVADSMSKEKYLCLARQKKVRYRFLFQPESQGVYKVDFERLKVEEVDSCN